MDICAAPGCYFGDIIGSISLGGVPSFESESSYNFGEIGTPVLGGLPLVSTWSLVVAPGTTFPLDLKVTSTLYFYSAGFTPTLTVDFSGDLALAAPVPLPAALPLMAGGLGAFGLIGWRRGRRKAASSSAAA
jgi:hypothetical protein